LRTVVDGSVAVKWYFPERGHAEADRILAAAASGERELLAPDLIAPEFTNVLWKKIQLSQCDRETAEAILALWETDRPTLLPSVELAPRGLALAIALQHPVYDCLYLAAAIEYEAALATADRRLAKAARSVLSAVEWIG
jgi:predicted nucleic acid-binding protein